jgi:hypothetical protein
VNPCDVEVKTLELVVLGKEVRKIGCRRAMDTGEGESSEIRPTTFEELVNRWKVADLRSGRADTGHLQVLSHIELQISVRVIGSKAG